MGIAQRADDVGEHAHGHGDRRALGADAGAERRTPLNEPLPQQEAIEFGFVAPSDDELLLASDEFAGNIGNDVLRRFRVIFDYSRRSMVLESN
jgi:hypothetical protein